MMIKVVCSGVVVFANSNKKDGFNCCKCGSSMHPKAGAGGSKGATLSVFEEKSSKRKKFKKGKKSKKGGKKGDKKE